MSAIGSKMLDVHLTVNGQTVIVEAKGTDGVPTLRQWQNMLRYHEAGALVLLVGPDDSDIQELQFLFVSIASLGHFSGSIIVQRSRILHEIERHQKALELKMVEGPRKRRK